MQDAVLVVAACNEPLAWLEALLRYDQSLRGVVIEQCNPQRRSSHPRMQVEMAHRCGREASSYLFFLVHHWQRLPAHMFFMQADLPKHWHKASAAAPPDPKNTHRRLQALAGGAATVQFFTGGFAGSTLTVGILFDWAVSGMNTRS